MFHIFEIMYARIFKFHIGIAYKKLAGLCFFVFSVRFFMVKLAPFSDLSILAIKIL